MWTECEQRRLWSDWADAQADLSPRWAHMPLLLVLSWGGSIILVHQIIVYITRDKELQNKPQHNKILFMHCYTCIWSMLWRIHIIFPNFSTELCPLIDFRIMFMLNIWYRYIDIFYAKTCATTKISTMAGYHVVLATLLFKFRYFENYKRNLDR